MLYSHTNGVPTYEGGKTTHMEVGPGQVSNRVLTVGSHSRALKIAKHLESIEFQHTSKREFTTITGTYNGVRVSICAIGMGMPMMDFFVRETCAVVSGPLVIIRFGTCGGLADSLSPGTVCIVDEAAAVTRNFDAFDNHSGSSLGPHYNMSGATSSDVILSDSISAVLQSCLRENSVIVPVARGLNVSADSFYGSQGRKHPDFDDHNDSLIQDIKSKFSNAQIMEMETYMLLHLAACSKGKVRASAAAIVLSNRTTGDVIPESLHETLEEIAGFAVLKVLASAPIENTQISTAPPAPAPAAPGGCVIA